MIEVAGPMGSDPGDGEGYSALLGAGAGGTNAIMPNLGGISPSKMVVMNRGRHMGEGFSATADAAAAAAFNPLGPEMFEDAEREIEGVLWRALPMTEAFSRRFANPEGTTIKITLKECVELDIHPWERLEMVLGSLAKIQRLLHPQEPGPDPGSTG